MNFKNLYKEIVEFVTRLIDEDFFGMASEMAFIFTFGIFPCSFVLLSIFSWLGKKSLIVPLWNTITTITPADTMQLVNKVVHEVLIFEKGGLVSLISICITLFLALNVFAVIMKGLNRAYGIEETRSFLFTRVLALAMVFVNALILFLCINTIILGKVIIEFISIYNAEIEWAWANLILFLRWPVTFLALFLVTWLNYYVLPDIKRAPNRVKSKSAIPGALFFSIFWLLGSWLFSIYVGNLNTYNVVYGTIGTIIMLMVWLYYTSLLMLIGGELGSKIYKKLIKNLN